MTSTRLKSEEVYRERVASNSLFTAASIRNKSKVTSLFDDSDSGEDLFASASPGSRSLQNSEQTPSKAPNKKKNSLFDDEDDLFGPQDAPDVDLFGAAHVKNIAKTTDELIDKSDKADNPQLVEKNREKANVNSLFGNKEIDTNDFFGEATVDENPKAPLSSEAVFKEPTKPSEILEKKTTSTSKDIFKDSENSDLFQPSFAETVQKGSGIFPNVTKSIFADTTDADLFGKESNILEKNVLETSSNLFSESKESEDLFGSAVVRPVKEPDTNLFTNISKTTKPKRFTSSIFDDSDDDDQDLFGGPSLSKNTSKDIFQENRNMDSKKEPEAEKIGKKDENIKPEKKKTIFSDDVDEDSLFGEKNSKNSRTKQAILPKAILSEINEKLEKHRTKIDTAANVVDNITLPKNDPANSLNIQASIEQQQQPKKPPVSNKIKNLLGKMGDLKILSPTDTPPLRRKNSDKEEEQEPTEADLSTNDASSIAGGHSHAVDSTSTKLNDKLEIKSKSCEEEKSTTNLPKDRNSDSEKKVEAAKEEKTSSKKTVPKNSIFDEDDEDDLFGEKTKKDNFLVKTEVKNEEKNESEVIKNQQNKEPESNTNPELDTKLDIASKKAVLDDIKQKIDNNKISADPSPSAVDGAVASKKCPPKSLKFQAPIGEQPQQQQQPKKPVVSNKIKNLMGKMADLKILSPIDTPPLLRTNSEENNAKEEEPESAATDLTSSEVSSSSLASGGSSPQTSGTSKARDSPSLMSDNTELAISLDEPAQIETLLSTSKSRARIPGKRRPQSRHARQSALLHSGIDFDFDATDATNASSILDAMNDDSVDSLLVGDRLLPSRTSRNGARCSESGHQQTDDRSEMSASRNTTTNLLSPSTDEEDLFDVPPDLPEDPAVREDSLFGRAPILSPVETLTELADVSDPADDGKATRGQVQEDRALGDESWSEKTENLDPLRDSSHDPLKDPSQLFAFVTKTPSPEKNKGLILSQDDDSLFSNTSKPVDVKSKPGLNLFNDDDDTSNSDIFSSCSKIKKPLKDTKIDRFDNAALDDDDDAILFGFAPKKSKESETDKQENVTTSSASAVPTNKKTDFKSSTKTATKDIFDNSSDEEDLFVSKKKIISKNKTKLLFGDDGDNVDEDDIFGKPKKLSLDSAKDKTIEDNTRPIVQKANTRDLKKTAEKIVEDPLSILQGE